MSNEPRRRRSCAQILWHPKRAKRRRCKNTAQAGSEYCYLHGPLPSDVEAELKAGLVRYGSALGNTRSMTTKRTKA